jgi:hypothetical protein
MSTNESTEVEGTDVKPRLYRALTEYHTVYPEGGDVYSVTSQSGNEYAVDARDGRCTCPDAQFNLTDDDLCKHALRVAVVRGERVIPAAIDRNEVDPQLGIAVDSTPVAVATDGGQVPAADTTDDGPDRPTTCGCWGQDDLPCWPCYRAGFSEPNPDADE